MIAVFSTEFKRKSYYFIKNKKNMLTWKDVISFASKGNPTPDKTVQKTDKE